MLLRNFFAGLVWSSPEDGFSFPVFKRDEVKNLPLKRLKHLFLVQLGLRDIVQLQKDIKQYPMSVSGIFQARKFCSEFYHDYLDNSETMTIVKIVFANISMGLPNYRIFKYEQVEEVFEDVQNRYLNRADEFWLCQTNVSKSITSFGGRVSFPIDMEYKPEIIEMVWHASPRMLDHFNIGDYPYQYLKAIRFPGKLNFSIDILYIPSQLEDHISIQQKMLQDFHLVITNLCFWNDRINNLCKVLLHSKVNEVVLEYKFDSGIFQWIDWDTNVETEGFLSERLIG